MLPITDATDPLIRVLKGRCKTRPANSPTRFGVKKLTVIPVKTDKTEAENDTGVIFPASNFHLTASVNQFTSIKTKMKAINHSELLVLRISLNSSTD